MNLDLKTLEYVKHCMDICSDATPFTMGYSQLLRLIEETKSKTIDLVPDFEYEMFFKSEPDDFCKIDGWYPIATDKIKNPENIEKYIESGLLRKIK